MPYFPTRGTIRDMTLIDDTDVFVLEEFRLRIADTDGSAAALVLAESSGTRDPVPLLTSIDDARDVASLRTVPAGAPDGKGPRDDVALGPLVDAWRPMKRFVSRIAARTEGAPATSFRLAVTESGINDQPVAPPGRWAGQPAAGDPVALLLIGVPEGTHAGLLVLVGRDGHEPPTGGGEDPSWPLPLSRDLGVRVYKAGV